MELNEPAVEQPQIENTSNQALSLSVLRNHSLYQQHLQDKTFGVKGPCILSHLKYFKPIESTCIDHMHSLFEGVCKNYFKYWFSSKFSSEAFSLRKYQHVVDERLLSIRPPKFVASTPRSVLLSKLWHAHEYVSFFLYYSLPVFRNLLPFTHYENLKKLVVFMEVILSKSVSVERLEFAQKLIEEFMKESSSLYPPNIYTSGFHELLNLVDCTLNHGHLNATNCFQYEELNRKICSFFHSFDLIGEEFIKVFITAQSLSIVSKACKKEKLKNWFEKYPPFRSSNKKNPNKQSKIKILGSLKTSFDSKFLNVYEKYFGKKKDCLDTFTRVELNGIVFDSYEKKINRCDACFYTKREKDIGLIEGFFYEDNNVYVLAKRIVPLLNPFYCDKIPELKSKLKIVYLSDEYFIQPIDKIKKCAFMQIKQETYVSTFTTSHLFT